MKRVLSPAVLLVAVTSTFAARTCIIDGEFVPPPDCPTCPPKFTVSIAIVDESTGSRIGSPTPWKVDGYTHFKQRFSPPHETKRIKVAYTPSLSGFASCEQPFDLEPNVNTLYAFQVSWLPTGRNPNTIVVKNETKIKELISSPTPTPTPRPRSTPRPSPPGRTLPTPTPSPTPRTLQTSTPSSRATISPTPAPGDPSSALNRANYALAVARTGDEKLRAANLKISVLLFERKPKDAFDVYHETAAEPLFGEASFQSKKSFVNQWFVNLEGAARNRGATYDRQTGLLFTSLPPSAKGMREQFASLTNAVLKTDQNRQRASRLRQAIENGNVADQERVVREFLNRWPRPGSEEQFRPGRHERRPQPGTPRTQAPRPPG